MAGTGDVNISKEDAEIQFMRVRGEAIRAAVALAKKLDVLPTLNSHVGLLNSLSRQSMMCNDDWRPFWNNYRELYRAILGLGIFSSASDLRGSAGFLRDPFMLPWYCCDEAWKLWRAVMKLAKSYEDGVLEGRLECTHD